MRFALGSEAGRLLVCSSLVVLLSGVVSCTESSSSGGGLGELSVFISPEEPVAPDTLFGGAEIQHPEGVTITFVNWQWTLDGEIVPAATGPNIPSFVTSKHQVWQVSVQADDGTTLTEREFSEEVEIRNSPPVVSGISIRPLPPEGVPVSRRCDDDELFTQQTVVDADNDPVTLAHEWRVNNVVVATTATLDPSLTNVGDSVLVRITPSDDEESGSVAGSSAVIIETCPAPLAAPRDADGEPPVPRPLAASAGAGALTLSPPSSAPSPQDRSDAQEPVASEDTAPAEPHTDLAASPSPLSVGAANVCNLAADGSLVCTGSEEFGLNAPPEGLFSQVKVELDYACAIRAADGGVQCWGRPLADVGQLVPPEGAFSQIDLGPDAGCGLRSTGEVACWGGDSLASTAPQGAFTHLDVFDSYACAIRTDGEVRCWGDE